MTHFPTTSIYCYSKNAIDIAHNKFFYEYTKHIEIDRTYFCLYTRHQTMYQFIKS